MLDVLVVEETDNLCDAARQVEATWEDLCRQMLTIRQVFLYMDRSFVVATPGVRSLFDMGLQLFRTHLAQHAEVRESQGM